MGSPTDERHHDDDASHRHTCPCCGPTMTGGNIADHLLELLNLPQ
jgi:hypothetical protein